MKLAMFQMENAGSIQKNLEKSLNAFILIISFLLLLR